MHSISVLEEVLTILIIKSLKLKIENIFTLQHYLMLSCTNGSYLSKRGYVLKKENLSQEELSSLKLELKGRPLQDDKFNNFNKINPNFPLYIETKNKLYIPKMYGLKKYGQPDSLLPNYLGKSWTKNIKFNGELYPIQIDACQVVMNECINTGGGILSLGTGLGKSISCLHILSKLKGKTIIIVNKIPLMKQWESEIKNFLPQATVGIIQGQKNINVEDADIIIAMLQSLARIDYPDSLFQDIKICVVDEAHNICSKVFSQALSKLCSQYTIGLTATPNRSDGCEYIFKWYLGDVVFKSKTERAGLLPILNIIKIDSNEYKEIATVNKTNGQKQIQYTSMLSDLVQMPKRNKLIVELLKDLIKEGRKILVLSDRRNHLTTIKHLFDLDPSISFTIGMFVGQMKISDLEKSKTCDIILATYSAFSEGVSVKELNTLLLITPKKFIGHLKNTTKNESGKMEQIVGRIFRKDHTDIHPMIIDIYDNFSVYKNQANQRKIFYKQHFNKISTKEQSINLDDFPIENINTSCLKSKNNKTKNKNIDEQDNTQQENKIYLNCIIDE